MNLFYKIIKEIYINGVSNSHEKPVRILRKNQWGKIRYRD
jgi:hypothetical protein